MEVPKKECRGCHESLPLWAFAINQSAPDNRSHFCAECSRKKQKPNELERIRKKCECVCVGEWHKHPYRNMKRKY